MVVSDVQAVLFDLDGTLHDRDEMFRRWATWFVRERLQVRQEAAHRAVVDHLVHLDAQGYGSKEALFGWVTQQFASVAESSAELITRFRQERNAHLMLSHHTQHLLDALSHRGIPFGIVTNGAAEQQLKICQLGLDQRAACVVISAVVGCKKPDPAIFHAAVDHLRVPPGRILFVGDHPENDIVGAAGVGMQTAWLHHGRDWPSDLAPTRPDHTIGSLADLLWLTDQGS
jgi:putative hydrolase of the HAD superfamily